MNCLSCGLPSGYNRVLVERESETEVGGLCIECEERRFGGRLRRESTAGTGGCSLCTRDAHVAVPEWDPDIDITPDGTIVHSDYRVTDETAGLCEEHFGSIVDADPTDETLLQTSPRPSR